VLSDLSASLLNTARASGSPGSWILTILAFLILILLISLVEMVALQLLRWGDMRQAIKASLAMNIASSIIGIILLILVPRPHLGELLVAWVFLVLTEGSVLMRIRPGSPGYNWLASIVANAASYIILILPAFLYR
jgi:hypothetical protein